MPANLDNSAVATGLEKSVFISIPKKSNGKECSNYCTIALISQVSKVMFKILQARLSLTTLRALWRQPWAAAVGEVTRWVDLLDGDPDLVPKIRAARDDGKRVEGHAAGASYERLVGLAAAGFTSCHEAVTAQEARDRLRAGLITMLRHSSIRPDLPELLTAITRDDIETGRVMLTADGPTPAVITERGYLDYLLAVAIHSGVAPLDALRMVTLNPAQYYGFRDVGEIAVG